MPSSDTDIDIELLQEYAKSRADELFTALVEGHIDLVFSAALRQVHSQELAQEVTQSVFIELARQKESQLRRLVDARPDQRVPEMDLLSDRTWLDIARDADLNTEEGVGRAFAELRRIAKNTLAPEFSDALLKYLNDYEGQLPARIAELKPLKQAFHQLIEEPGDKNSTNRTAK